MEVSGVEDQDDKIDWEDLESRLYSQIYHAAPEEVDDAMILQMTLDMNTEIVKKKRYRYFEEPKDVPNQKTTQLPSYIPLENSAKKTNICSIATVQRHISSETGSTSTNVPTHVHNNITVNQFRIPPLIFQSEEMSPSEPLSYLAPWHANALKAIEKEKIQEKKRKRKEKLQRRLDRRRNNRRVANEKKAQNCVTIFVDSDNSDDECVVVETECDKDTVTEVRTGFPKKYDESNGGKKPEDDDEIIYIPPPPVEVINVDTEDVEQASSEEPCTKLDIPSEDHVENTASKDQVHKESSSSPVPSTPIETSNDFLDNVSLQGSDTNNQNDFVKPSNRIEFCETESSCSTNEHSRDFSNTVKTIVFHEVDFPKEDIFADKNLEGFGSFITPKRTSRKSKESPHSETVDKSQFKNSVIDESSSDDSSSESDYPESMNQSISMSSERHKKLPSLSLMIPPDTPNSIPKKKKTASDISEDDATPKSRKTKSSNSMETTPKLKKKQKKKERIPKQDGVSYDKEKKRKKKKRHSEGDDSSNILNTTCEEKQKKRKSLNNEESESSTIEKLKKRKKKCSTSNDEQDNCEAGTLDTNLPKLTINTVDTIEDNQNQHIPSVEKDNTLPIPAEVEESVSATSETEIPISQLNNSALDVIEINYDVEIVPSESESEENDFRVLDDVGADMELANCSAQLPTVTDEEQNPIFTEDNTGSISKIDHTKEFENFDLEYIQSKQSDDPEKWQISYKDKGAYLDMSRARGPRCNRCRHFGHFAVKCTEKPNPPRCYLCGQPDHQEPRCPNKRCTQCGNQGNFSTSYCWKCFKFRHTCCKLCNMTGHLESSCPDLWRRYHATTEEGPIIVSQAPPLPRERQWCSGCAGQGHLEHECNYYNREYPPTTPFIVRYDDNLAQTNARRPYNQTEPSTSVAPQFLAPNRGPLANTNLLPLANLVPLRNLLPALVPNQAQVPNPFAITPLFAQAQLPVRRPAENSRIVEDFSLTNAHVVDGETIDLVETTKIRNFLQRSHFHLVHQFIVKEMEELDVLASRDFKVLRKKLFKYRMMIDNAQTGDDRGRRFLFRMLNMAIFGLHGSQDGKIHLNVLRSFVETSRIVNRKSLISAYDYIFGNDKRNLNYFGTMHRLIFKAQRGKPWKPLHG